MINYNGKWDIFLFPLLGILVAVSLSLGSAEGLDKLGEIERSKMYHQMVADSGVTMGQIDLDDVPLQGLTGEQARDILFQRYKARMMQLHEPRAFDLNSGDSSEKEIAEICGNSATLECGRKVLKNIPSSDPGTEQNLQNQPTVFRRCNLRKEFVDCIDIQRTICRQEVERGIYPRLPPKSILRATQSKIWRALWTSGGCTLIQ